MKRKISLLLVLVLLFTVVFTGCNNTEPAGTDEPEEPAGTNEPAEPSGTDGEGDQEPVEEGITYAEEQVYNSVYSGEISTLNYLVTATTAEFGLAANFVDTLVDYDKYGVLIPCLATEWSASDDGLVWTFKIREGVNWYTNDGEVYAEVTAQDFVDAAKYIFTSENGSSTANIAYRVIKNAEAYYDGEITDFEEVGVKAIDKYTLQYTLSKPVPYFESMLTYACFFPVNGTFLEEVGELFGTSNDALLYNGAYILDVYEPQNRKVLLKNENYWDKDKVFIEKIVSKYNKEAGTIAQELFNRGEISAVSIPSDSIATWMGDPDLKDKIRPATASFYTYFIALNFNPTFDEVYEPENWKLAVNNKNFRKTIFHGFNRLAAMTIEEPYNPQNKLMSTVTPRGFATAGGKGFTKTGDLANFSGKESFDLELALDYKEKAMEELDGIVEFPVKVMLPYSAGSSTASQRAQVIKQQLEKDLGDDFIEIYILAYPSSGYLNNTRRAGNYSFDIVNWGPDYADPETYTDMFVPGSNYNFPEMCEEVDADGNKTFDVYMSMIEEAQAEIVDIERRYELFANAEAYLIEEAWVIPYREGGGGYISSLLNPFEAPYSPFGVSSERWKGQRILSNPMSSEQFVEEKANWKAEREKALNEAGY